MKTTTFLLLSLFFILNFQSLNAQDGSRIEPDKACINCDTPEASAVIEIKSTNKGMLVPRMTSTQRTAISGPANGLLVFDVTTGSFWYYESSAWQELVGGNPTDELQTISKTGSTVTLSNSGGSFTDDVNDADASTTNEIQMLSKSGSTVSLSIGGGSFTDEVDDADPSATNEIQMLSKSGSTVSLSNGGGSFTDAVDDADADATNEIQSLSLSGLDLSISGVAGTVSIADNDNDAANEIQMLSKSGSTVSLSNGGGSFTDAVDDADADPMNEIQTIVSADAGNLIAAGTDGGAIITSIDKIVDTDGDTQIRTEASMDEDKIHFDLGGIERWVMDYTRLEPVNSGNSVFIGNDAGVADDLSNNNNVGIG